MNSRSDRYSLVIIAVHWLTLLLLVAVYFLIEWRDIYPNGSAGRDLMKQWHFMLGLTVFALFFLRVAARMIWPTPAIMPAPPMWQQRLAHMVLLALYLFLLVMPLLGWATLSAKGKVVPFFGLELPPILGPDKELGKRLEDMHEFIGGLGYWLIGLHAAAAIFHQHVMRDNTLRRMLP